VSESHEKYWLYTDVCDIPSDIRLQLKLMNVSRAVCRFACSDVYDKRCSGFLYSRRQRKCTLSPYTGELISITAPQCNSTNGLEFYRRQRLLGSTSMFYAYAHMTTQISQRLPSLIFVGLLRKIWHFFAHVFCRKNFTDSGSSVL